jgi:protein-S-isoprenylcysteine O-methyltransferase Ste14
MTSLPKSALQITLVAFGFSVMIWRLLLEPLTLSRDSGLLLAVAAFALWVAARIQLGASFSVRARATALVTHGVYSKIRNPIYVSGSLYLAGIVIALGHPKFLALELIMIPIQIVRARREARVLEEKFGAAYREYRRETWF